MSMVDDDDGVGLGTDGPLISLKTHEDSRAEGWPWWYTAEGRGGGREAKSLPLEVSARLVLASWGPKHRANHHMSYVYAYSCTPVMHVYENMLRRVLRQLHAYPLRPAYGRNT